MKLVKNRPRPDLPDWYEVGGSSTLISLDSDEEGLESSVDSDRGGPESDFWKELKWLDDDRGRVDRTEKDKMNVARAVASQLELKTHEKDEIERHARNLNGQAVGCWGGIRALAIGVTAYVVNKRRMKNEDFGLEDQIQYDEEFIELAERIDVREIDEVVKKVNEMI